MKFLFFLLFFIACQDYNSTSSDESKYGDLGLDESDPNFRDAYLIIQDRCISCHTGEHNDWASLKSSEAWANEVGLIVKGDPYSSEFILRIKNTNDPNSNSNMPIDGSELPEDEYEHLIDWVTNIP